MGNARHLLFLMDSCYGGMLGAETRESFVDPRVPDYVSNIASRITRQVLTAGGKGQEVVDGGSKGHSIFVDAILEALVDGKADKNRNGYITFNELSDYVMQRASNHYQTPLASVLPGNRGESICSVRRWLAHLPVPGPDGTAADGLRSAEPDITRGAEATDGTNVVHVLAIKRILVAVLDDHEKMVPSIPRSYFHVYEGELPAAHRGLQGRRSLPNLLPGADDRVRNCGDPGLYARIRLVDPAETNKVLGLQGPKGEYKVPFHIFVKEMP